MKRKASFTIIPRYNRVFKLQPSKNIKGFNFEVLLFIITAVILRFAYPKFMCYSKDRHHNFIARTTEKDIIAFHFLMNSGFKKLHQSDFNGAYYEFKLAKAIYPENETVKRMLIKTNDILNHDNSTYKNRLD